jgi:hypothetical protein
MTKRQLKSAGPILRLEFLQERLLEAEGREDKDAAKAIRAIMEREGLSTMWREIKFATNDSAGRSTSVKRVQRMEGSRLVEYNTKEEVEACIQEENQGKFSAAESSTFFQGLLGAQLGYLSDTAVAKWILDYLDDAAALLLDEMGRIGRGVIVGAILPRTSFSTGRQPEKAPHRPSLASISATTLRQASTPSLPSSLPRRSLSRRRPAARPCTGQAGSRSCSKR